MKLDQSFFEVNNVARQVLALEPGTKASEWTSSNFNPLHSVLFFLHPKINLQFMVYRPKRCTLFTFSGR
jgi:hypothetical protein